MSWFPVLSVGAARPLEQVMPASRGPGRKPLDNPSAFSDNQGY